MLAVSSAFRNAEVADVNKPTAQVLLVLGNYATSAFGATIASSGEDASGNYPDDGAIDGDRTELNVGAASAAENDVGKSSWRSAAAPSSSTQTLTINLGQSRTINRIKLYHLAGHGLSKFKLAHSSNGTDFTDFAATSQYGLNVQLITTTGELDTIDFDDIDCQYVRLIIDDTAVAADKANVVELEIYRLVDISDRVISVRTGRNRDYQLGNPLSAQATIVCDNSDQFFSPSYTPTSAQSDFVNSELAPGIGLIVKYGFDFIGTQEYAQSFVGTVDKLMIRPGAREATFQARDGMKALLNREISTKLKEGQDIGDLIEHMLGLANISAYEMEIDNTTIEIDYFFTERQTIMQTIQDLVAACGDAIFYFSETGVATFQIFLNSVPQEELISSQGEWDAGTKTNIDSASNPGTIQRSWYKIDDFADGNFSSNPVWSSVGYSAWTVSSALIFTAPGLFNNSHGIISANPFTSDGLIYTATANQTFGTWRMTTRLTDGSGNGSVDVFFIQNGNVFLTISTTRYNHATFQNGYFVTVDRQSGNISLGKTDNAGNRSIIAVAASGISSGVDFTLSITRTTGGLMTAYIDGVQKVQGTDTSITTSQGFAIRGSDGDGSGVTWSTYRFAGIYYSSTITGTGAVSTAAPEWISPVIDQGATILAEGIFQATAVVPTGCTVTYYTATSADGVSFDAYVQATHGQIISSTARRYIRLKIVMSTPQDSGTYNFTTPLVQDATLHWFTGTGSTKFGQAVSFVFDSVDENLEIEQHHADTIGGDTAIINNVSVKAQPLILSGADSDVKWQGTVGTPPAAVSGSNPINVVTSDVLTYQVVVDGGMDTSRMSGANPAAAVVTFGGGATGSWRFSTIHPTKPILEITITNSGTITALQVQGKAFANDDTILEKTASDEDSIKKNDDRHQDISNAWIVSASIAQAIADRLVDNFSDPTTFVPRIRVRPTFSVQLGDRVTVEDDHLSISEDYLVIGVEQKLMANLGGGEVDTTLSLLKVVT